MTPAEVQLELERGGLLRGLSEDEVEQYVHDAWRFNDFFNDEMRALRRDLFAVNGLSDPEEATHNTAGDAPQAQTTLRRLFIVATALAALLAALWWA
jgi:hypothetical protein